MGVNSGKAVSMRCHTTSRAAAGACANRWRNGMTSVGRTQRALARGIGAMSVDRNTVARIARLARIEVPEGELEHIAGELNGILAWIEQLQAVDTTGVEPMTSAVASSLPLRADLVSDGGILDNLMANAPDPHDGFFTVPKVVE